MARSFLARAPADRMVVIAIAILALVFFMLVSRAFYGNTHITQQTPTQLTRVEALAQTTTVDRDSDGDGLADWEELLWGTDPNEKDSDHNGVSDKDERLSGGISASLASNSGVGTVGETKAEAPHSGTITDAVARELMGTLMQTFASGKEITASEQKILVDNALMEVGKTLAITPTYGLEDVRTTLATTVSRGAYVKEVVGLLDAVSKETPGEYDALIRITQQNMDEGIAALNNTIMAYERNIDILKNLQVPTDAAQLHVNIIANYEAYIRSLKFLASMKEDPVLASAGLNMMMTTQTTLSRALAELYIYKMNNDKQSAPKLTPSEPPTQ